jgi:HEPN domain-containing protein
MRNKESILSKDWIEKAKRDLKRVEIMLDARDYGDAGFHLQQTIEKCLKAYLLSKGWELERTHDLVKLINYAIKYDPAFKKFIPLCETATEYYIEERYPFIVSSDLTKKEIEKRLGQAKEIIKMITK